MININIQIQHYAASGIGHRASGDNEGAVTTVSKTTIPVDYPTRWCLDSGKKIIIR